MRHPHTAAALLALLCTTAAAQTNGSNSPYSRYGVGLLNNRTSAGATAMAGTSLGWRKSTEVNYRNPASYSAIDSLTMLFDVALTLQNTNIQEGSQRINARNTSADYVTAGFRAFPHVGISVGMMPFSTIGYSMKRTRTMDTSTGETTQTDTYSGDGGLHEAYLGVGWEPFRGLSVGVNGGFLWGDMTHTVSAVFSDATINSRRRQYDSHVQTYNLGFGLQYEHRLDPRNTLVLGLTYGLGHACGGYARYYDQQLQGGAYTGDTITLHRAYDLPHTFGAGLVWNHASKLRVGADYTLQKWSRARSPQLNLSGSAPSYTASTGAYTDMSRLSLGAEYVENETDFRWLRRIRYRAGLAIASPYAKINGQKGPRTYQATAGVALPIINTHSNRCLLNIAAGYERVQPQHGNMLKENHLHLSIGLTFNESWFNKWKAQ